MTSNAIRGIRRKKSSLSEVKVAVIGAPAVGKSGEYSKKLRQHRIQWRALVNTVMNLRVL
jgi:hypothetical protein